MRAKAYCTYLSLRDLRQWVLVQMFPSSSQSAAKPSVFRVPKQARLALIHKEEGFSSCLDMENTTHQIQPIQYCWKTQLQRWCNRGLGRVDVDLCVCTTMNSELYEISGRDPNRDGFSVCIYININSCGRKNSTKRDRGEKNVLEGRMDLLAQCPDHPTKDKAIKKIDKRNVRVFSLGTSGQSLG
ncbi:hypothetical protein TNCV_4266451 [Trichonephila clavipes]|nr:hypothetical protein TNCV_4266451 [Trichonephila clavipes]